MPDDAQALAVKCFVLNYTILICVFENISIGVCLSEPPLFTGVYNV